MNAPTNRVAPAPLVSSEPTDFGGFVPSACIDDQTEAEARQEAADARKVWIVIGVVMFVLAAAIYVAGVITGFYLWAVP